MAWVGGLIAAGGALAGGLLKNDASRSQAHEANDFSAAQYATRWQTTTADMKAAGLNPMLAYTQGVGNSPSGQQADVSDFITPAVNAYNQYGVNNINSAQTANINADTENKRKQGDLIEAQAAQAWANASQSNQNIELMKIQASKIVQEIDNLKTEKQRTEALILNVAAATGLIDKQTLTEVARARNLNTDSILNVAQTSLVKSEKLTEMEKQIQIRALVKQIGVDIDLSKLDFDAATKLGNIGRGTKELAPLFDIVRGIMSMTTPRARH